MNLASGREARYRRTGNRMNLQPGIEAYHRAIIEALDLDLEVALNAALNWGDWAGERQVWTEATQAYSLALDAADRLSVHQLPRADKELWLHASSGLGARAAQAAALAARARVAAALMERGRARLLAESLASDRIDLARLAVVDGDLAARFTQAVDELAPSMRDHAATEWCCPASPEHGRHVPEPKSAGRWAPSCTPEQGRYCRFEWSQR